MADAKRTLLAILAADVAGYSRLMGDDERATMDMLNLCRDVFRKHISDHKGRVVDTAGDSVLATFPSVVESVACALDVQGELDGRNADLPDSRRMLFRIGVNLGDVFEQDDGTVYGDGVNVAARLEGLAEPGGIAVSEDAYRQVEGKTKHRFEDVGRHEVKNIARPVRAYRVVESGKAAQEAPSEVPTQSRKPSIAVLPFDNISGDPEQGYFADGISEDVITDLSKVSSLLVIARNSTFAYKGTSPNIEQVCRELGVHFVLEGSVRKAGGRVRVTAQLIDGSTGGHLWAERYDRELDDIFEVQDDVTRHIVTALKIELTAGEKTILAHKDTTNLDAYDAFLRGRAFLETFTRDGCQNARPWLEKAISLDPDFAAPVASMAMIPMTAYLNKWDEDGGDLLQAGHDLAEQAVELDDLEPNAHLALSIALLWMRKIDRAIVETERAIVLDPNFALAYFSLAVMRHYAGDSTAALKLLTTSTRLDPHVTDLVLHNTALCHFMLGDYGAATTKLRQRIAQSPDTDISRALLAATYGQQGRVADAQEIWAELLVVNPEYSFAQKREILPYKNPQDLERIVEGLRKAGIEISDPPAATG